jgi:hypothetical protein
MRAARLAEEVFVSIVFDPLGKEMVNVRAAHARSHEPGNARRPRQQSD